VVLRVAFYRVRILALIVVAITFFVRFIASSGRGFTFSVLREVDPKNWTA